MYACKNILINTDICWPLDVIVLHYMCTTTTGSLHILSRFQCRDHWTLSKQGHNGTITVLWRVSNEKTGSLHCITSKRMFLLVLFLYCFFHIVRSMKGAASGPQMDPCFFPPVQCLALRLAQYYQSAGSDRYYWTKHLLPEPAMGPSVPKGGRKRRLA